MSQAKPALKQLNLNKLSDASESQKQWLPDAGRTNFRITSGIYTVCVDFKKILFYLLVLASPFWGFVDQNNDVQIWVTESTVVGRSERLQFHLTNEWRFGNDISQWFYTYLEGVLKIQCTDRIDLGPGYRQIWKLQQDKRRLSYEPMLNVIFHHKEVFQWRNRLSYIIEEKERNVWQYRMRIRLRADYWTYNPFFSNEIFIRSQDGFFKNRTQVGFNIPLWNRASSDLYYMLQFREDAKTWTHQHIFGFWLHMRF